MTIIDYMFLIILGYEGYDCDQNIDECERLKPCQNNGSCSDTPGGYKCSCPLGFAGTNCDQVRFY